MSRDKRKPVVGKVGKKGKPVVPDALAPSAGKPIAPKGVLGLHADPMDDDRSHPMWRLSLLDREHKGSWSWGIDEATLGLIVDFLIQMERLTWWEIRRQLARKKNSTLLKHHEQSVDTLCEEAQQRLVELGLEDWDELFRFRIDGAGRLWGVLSNESPRVFYPIWWDRDHQVYPVGRG